MTEPTDDTTTTNEHDQALVRQLFGDRPDPAHEPSEDDDPETVMRKFTHRIFNRNTD